MMPALSLLAACSGSGPAGPGLRLAPLPPEVASECDSPEAILAPISWEAVAGRLGDALIECRGKHVAAVAAYRDAKEAIE